MIAFSTAQSTDTAIALFIGLVALSFFAFDLWKNGLGER